MAWDIVPSYVNSDTVATIGWDLEIGLQLIAHLVSGPWLSMILHIVRDVKGGEMRKTSALGALQYV